MESAPAKGTLYLIPCFIAETDYREVLPEKIREVVAPLQYFAVENIRSARRFIRRILPDKPIDPLTFYDIGKRSDRAHPLSARIRPGGHLRSRRSGRRRPRSTRGTRSAPPGHPRGAP